MSFFERVGNLLESVDREATSRLSGRGAKAEAEASSAVPVAMDGRSARSEGVVSSGSDEQSAFQPSTADQNSVAGGERNTAPHNALGSTGGGGSGGSGSDTHRLTLKIQHLEAQVLQVYEELEAVKRQRDSYRDRLERMDERQVSALEEEALALRRRVVELEAENESLIAAKDETAAAAGAAEASAAKDVADLQRQLSNASAQHRQAEEDWDAERSELNEALAAALKAAEDKASLLDSMQTTTEEEEEEGSMQRNALLAAEAAVLRERRSNAELRAKFAISEEARKAAENHVSAMEGDLKRLRSEYRSMEDTMKHENAKLKKELFASSNPSSVDNTEALAQRLLHKQSQLDSTRSELMALQNRFDKEAQRRREAEAMLRRSASTANARGAALSGTDIEVAAWDASSTAAAPPLQLRQRVPALEGGSSGAAMSRVSPLSRLHPFIAGHTHAAAVADVVDRAFVYAFRVLSVSPASRLLFLLYIAALHLFVFFVLAFHSHSLDAPPS